MIVFISIYNVNDNLLYLIFHGYCYDIFHICHKNWKIRENDTERYFILDLNAIPMLKYRTRKKIDWARIHILKYNNYFFKSLTKKTIYNK